MRIGVLYQGDIAGGYYRAVLPMREMERRRHTVLWPARPEFGAVLADLPDCDVVHIHRHILPKDRELIVRLRERGIGVVWDIDDHISTYPKANQRAEPVRRRTVRQGFERSKEIARQAHVTSAPSRFLVDVYRDAGSSDARLIENAVSAADIGHRRRRHAGVVVGWVAGREHETDVKKLRLAKVLRRLLATTDGFRLVTYGIDLGFRDPRYRYTPHVPIERLVRQETEFDIGIAPLADTPFNRGRSNIKVKEYASAGACWLASPLGPYADLGEDQGGVLVRDGDWHDTLQALIHDHARRADLAERARTWASTATIRQVGDAWERALRAAVAAARTTRTQVV